MREDMQLCFRILGSLECWDGRERVHLGGPVHERVLVTLLLEPDRVIPVSRLVEAVWDDGPPATATHQVRKAVAELRQRIPDGRSVIVTEGPGYRAAVTAAQLDLLRFTEGLRQAREAVAANRTAEAETALRGALALWRGPVLSGSCGPMLQAASAALDERRLTAVEQLFDLRLASGGSGELAGELRELIAAHPLRETLRGHLMLALYRSGRQADALEEYGKARDLLVEELGIGPGDALRELHQGILQNSPGLAAPTPPENRQAPQAPSPPAADELCSTLPYELRDFTGREEELSRLLEFAEEADGPGPLIVAIDGMGGSGKTSLAVRAAHQLTDRYCADRYSDAQLYLDLRGFTPGENPLSPGCAAEALVRMLGVEGERIPDDADSRLVLWRTMLTRRRVTLLLDNARDEAQIRPLLPVSAGSLVLVTSRTPLTDLDAAHCVSLGTMSPGDSEALVAGVIGQERARTEPEAVAELAELCGHLPLALRIAAARLRKRPRWTVRYLVDRLRDDTHRLAELSVGERSVEVTLRLSYEGLEVRDRQAFRLLGQHPGSELDVYTAAALLGTGTRDAEDVLEYLLDVHLMQQYETGRYAFHDLVRSFAHQLSRPPVPGGAGEEDEAAAAAVRRLLGFYQAATDEACDLLFPGRAEVERAAPEFVAELPPLDSADRARDWLDREQDALHAAVGLAYRRGLDRQVAVLAGNVAFQLDLRGRFEEFRSLGLTAVAASRRLGDDVLLRLSLSNLAVADWKVGRFEEGIETAEEARGLAVSLGDRRAEAKDTGVLGALLVCLGRFEEAHARLEQSIALKRELGAVRAEAESLTNLSTLYAEWGWYEEAAGAADRAIELDRRIGARDKEVEALTDLVRARLGSGETEAAAGALDRARALAPGVTSAADMALLWALSAEVSDRLGEEAQAAEEAQKALTQAGLSAMPIREATIRNIVGRLYERRGAYAMALDLRRQAHRTASAAGHRVEAAHALSGMATALECLGDEATASECRASAEEAFAAMGLPVRGRREDERSNA